MTKMLKENFMEAMSRAATFVAVATTDGEAGRHGVTVSSLTSVSADGEHPSLLVCIHRQSAASTAILQNGGFCANLLGHDQQSLSNLFAGRSGAAGSDRFADCAWHPGRAGQPMLAGAAASFECTLATSVLWESHFVIIGKVTAVEMSENEDVLLYGQRGYRRSVQIIGD